jgi:hypothetical protein
MGSKKDFSNLTNPADAMLDAMTPAKPTQTAAKKKRTTRTKAKPAKNESESRSRHTSFLLKPSTAASLKVIATLEGTSVNNIANELLEDYIEKYKADPAKAKKLKAGLELFS